MLRCHFRFEHTISTTLRNSHGCIYGSIFGNKNVIEHMLYGNLGHFTLVVEKLTAKNRLWKSDSGNASSCTC